MWEKKSDEEIKIYIYHLLRIKLAKVNELRI